MTRTTALLATLATFAAAPAAVDAQMATKDIVATAVDAGSFNTLAAALEAAGLIGVLQGEGPFTVFAPTDAAFAKLPSGTVEALLADKEALTRILTYHVVAGRVTSSQVVGLSSSEERARTPGCTPSLWWYRPRFHLRDHSRSRRHLQSIPGPLC